MTIIQRDILRMDTDSHRAFVGDEEVFFTLTEWKILLYLLESKGAVRSRIQITEAVDIENKLTNIVDVHLKNLRNKTKKADNKKFDPIVTVRGMGYRINA